jgi:hypothetical protein
MQEMYLHHHGGYQYEHFKQRCVCVRERERERGSSPSYENTALGGFPVYLVGTL